MFNIEDFNKHVTKIEYDGLVGYKCNKDSWVVGLQEDHHNASFEAYRLFQKHFIDGEYVPDLKNAPWLSRFFNWIFI